MPAVARVLIGVRVFRLGLAITFRRRSVSFCEASISVCASLSVSVALDTGKSNCSFIGSYALWTLSGRHSPTVAPKAVTPGVEQVGVLAILAPPASP
jgi:hypothetical protein